MPEPSTTYPEHDRLAAVQDESHAIGLFLDEGLSSQHLVLAEYVCSYTGMVYDDEMLMGPDGVLIGHRDPRWPMLAAAKTERRLADHAERDHEDGGLCSMAALVPAGRRIDAVLAAYYGLDLQALEDEKRAMLEQQRALNASRAVQRA